MDVLKNLMPQNLPTNILPALLWLGAGLLLAKLMAVLTKMLIQRRVGHGAAELSQRLVWYPAVILVLVSTLAQLGFDVSVLLGAAGVLTIAVGFAAQTSAANVISGLFLLGERPFTVGDIIQVDKTTGTIASIDLLSVKLCTFDNLMVRIPNEQLLKSNIKNLSFYPLRRIDIPLRVAYEESIETVRNVLFQVAEGNPHCLDEPEPLFMFTGFGQSGQQLTFCVWAETHRFIELRNEIQIQIKDAFDLANIDIALDQLVVRQATGSARLHSGI